ncbi:MAG: glycoside hydrolase N-terminal domain-containing protein [Planctomycetota bacterium]|nr:glycoside hydrolase N-terminal domain-containing protein [Planctomycetota bacterium]
MNDLRNKLWYDRPALDGNSALPVGNGRLGGMVFGRLREETIQLNEDSIWYGGPRNRINPNGRENLGRIRELRAETRLQCGENQSDDSGLLAFPMDIREQVVLHPGYRKTIE